MDLPINEREPFLEEICGHDQALKNEVKQLLQNDRTAFFEQPAIKGLVAEKTDYLEEAMDPIQINQYQITGRLGVGGMGVVYSAQQAFPAERQVAVKVLKSNSQKHLIEECHALARLNHPQIATLYEVGEWQNQHVYLAMELIKGIDVVSWCEQRNATTSQKIKLFQQLCAGVSHAHQRGIIHCDLKPSNVLVTDENGQATVKIIDFGIALFKDKKSRPYYSAGTPSYLCPEALEPDSTHLVDTSRDVYALGVLLHKLLTGFLPDADEADSALHDLPKDLQLIINHASAHHRDDRYGTVKELSDDLQRYLEHRVISVRSQNLLHSSRKFIQRNTMLVGFSVALLGMLIYAIITQTQQAEIARQEAHNAQVARIEAERLSAFMIDLFQISNPDQALKDKTTVIEMITQAKDKLLNLANPQAADAKFMFTLGSIFTRLDQLDDAQLLLEKALKLTRAQAPDDHVLLSETLAQLGVVYRRQKQFKLSEQVLKEALSINLNHTQDPAVEAYIHNHLGNLYHVLADVTAAIDHHQQAIELRKNNPDEKLLADSLNNLAALFMTQQRWSESNALLEQALTIYQSHFGDLHPFIGGVYNNMAYNDENLFEFQSAEENYQKAIEVTEATYGRTHRQTLKVKTNLAKYHEKRRQFAQSIQLWNEIIAVYEEQGDEDRLADAYSHLAKAYRNSGQIDQAAAFNQQAIQLITEHPSPDFHLAPRIKSRYAAILMAEEKLQEALLWLDEAILQLGQATDESNYVYLYLLNMKASVQLQMNALDQAEAIYQAILATATSNRLQQIQLIDAHLGMAKIHALRQQNVLASQHLNQAEELNQNIFGLNHPKQALIWSLMAQLDETKAAALLQQALALQTKILPSDHPDLVSVREALEQHH
ncbi:MAG: tetratricopeptide repeat protein [Marinicella sp.]